jgi:hypothetical protein
MFLEQPSPGMLNVKRLKKTTTFIRYAQRQKTEKTTTVYFSLEDENEHSGLFSDLVVLVKYMYVK